MLIRYKDTINVWQTINLQATLWINDELVYLDCEPTFNQSVSDDFTTSFNGRNNLVRRVKWDEYTLQFFGNENYHKELTNLKYCKDVSIEFDSGKIVYLDTDLPEYLDFTAETIADYLNYVKITLTFRDKNSKTEIDYLENAYNRYLAADLHNVAISDGTNTYTLYTNIDLLFETENETISNKDTGKVRVFRNIANTYVAGLFALNYDDMINLQKAINIGTVVFTDKSANTYTGLEIGTLETDLIDKNLYICKVKVLYNQVVSYPYA